MANTLQLFNHVRISDRAAVDWGTGELQSSHFDPNIIRAPTYLLKNQPIEQVYRKSKLELSNVRLNDQLVPKPFKINMLEKQIKQPFPMQHPFTSHMSQSALFPNYTAPEDSKRGESMLRSTTNIMDTQTPAQIEDSIVVEKTHGTPWRHEIKTLNLPTQRRGVWFNDDQYYHIPKPNELQQFYPYASNVLVPNPKLRPEERSIDLRTANVLRNKEKQLMQSSNQIDYYRDGLGTHAPLCSDDIVEKRSKYDSTGLINDTMKPYFKRGTGLSQYSTATSENKENKEKVVITPEQIDYLANIQQDKLLTRVEVDEIEMETGKEYRNYPESNYTNNPRVKTVTMTKPAPTLSRSNTMPNVKAAVVAVARQLKSAQNKLDAENRKITAENHQRIQAIQVENRKNDIDLITPDRDIRLLRLKNCELEKSRSAQPNLKQNVQPHVNTLYQQESKYYGERAQLYRTPVYNPYLVKQYIESVKAEPQISTNYTSGSGMASQANFQMPNDSYENRPKLFAHKVFSDYELLKRNPLEQSLTEPNLSASLNVQENGQILQQTTYGGSYNTKKFQQEHEPSPSRTSSELLYRPLESGELEYQNIAIKSATDHVALQNYKNGLSNNLDFHAARDIVDANDKKQKEFDKYQYPRLAGPMPPEPYETIYCADQISEMSDGNSKRFYTRVYDSPNSVPNVRYEPLRADLQAMSQYEAKAIRDQQINQEHIKKLEQNVIRRANGNEISFTDRSNETAARRVNEPIVVQQKERAEAKSTYMANYTPYTNEQSVTCPPNEYYKPVEYREIQIDSSQLPKNIIELRDKWSKSLANKSYLDMYQSSCPDLRKNISTGKRRIMEAPQYVYKFANH